MEGLDLKGFNIVFGIKAAADEPTRRFSKRYAAGVEIEDFFNEAKKGLGLEGREIAISLPGENIVSSNQDRAEVLEGFRLFFANFGDSRHKIPISVAVEDKGLMVESGVLDVGPEVDRVAREPEVLADFAAAEGVPSGVVLAIGGSGGFDFEAVSEDTADVSYKGGFDY